MNNPDLLKLVLAYQGNACPRFICLLDEIVPVDSIDNIRKSDCSGEMVMVTFKAGSKNLPLYWKFPSKEQRNQAFDWIMDTLSVPRFKIPEEKR